MGMGFGGIMRNWMSDPCCMKVDREGEWKVNDTHGQMGGMGCVYTEREKEILESVNAGGQGDY